MYINKENNMSYPNVINDLDVDINCERLFDKLYSNFNKYQKIKNNSKSQADDSTIYERADFITFIEHNPNFLNKFGMVSSSKLVDYYAEIFMEQSLLNYGKEKKSKIDMDKDYYAARDLVIQDSKNFRGNDKQSRVPNGQPFRYVSSSYYGNQKQQPTNYKQQPTKQAQPQARHYDDLSGLKIPSFMSRNNYHDDYHDYNQSNNIHSNNNRVNQEKKSSHSNKLTGNKPKRRIKGVDRTKKLLRGLAIPALVASLAIGGNAIFRAAENKNKLDNTTYEVSKEEGISPSSYLSNSGSIDDLLYSPMLTDNLVNSFNVYSLEDNFDKLLASKYINEGNYGIYKYIENGIASGELHSVEDLRNYSRANEVYSLLVMQDEFINSLGKHRDPKIRFASYKKAPDVKDDFKQGDYIISFYDRYGLANTTLFTDNFTSQYIDNSIKNNLIIKTSLDDIEKKCKNNENYKNTIDYYNSLINVTNLVSKSFSETNTFALRNHEKHFSLLDSKIVTTGVDFNSKKDVDKMKMNLNYNNDKDDERDDR